MNLLKAIRKLFSRSEESGRTWCEPIDGDPHVIKIPVKLRFDCDICCSKKHDPLELVIIHNPILHEDFYHVRCPKCWQHTDFFRTREEAIEAWDAHKR